MASVVTSVGGSAVGLTFAGGPLTGLLGLALIAGAGIVDQQFIYPAILGREEDAKPRRLLDIPQMTLAPGTPRNWAIGRRVRVPVHVMFQSEKTIEINQGGKAGQGGVIRQVLADVGLSLNDRPTAQLTQLSGNGKLVYYKSRNLVSVRTNEMVASESGGNLVLTMNSTAEPDFSDKFEVGDFVELKGFEANGGPNINVAASGIRGFWEVTAVTAHRGITTSTMTMAPRRGQSLVGLAATAGTPLTPAEVFRVDDAWIWPATATWSFVSPLWRLRHTYSTAQEAQEAIEQFRGIFASGDEVVSVNATVANAAVWRIANIGFYGFSSTAWEVTFQVVSGSAPGTGTTGQSPSATDRASLEFATPQTYTPGMFAADPANNYHGGTDTQGADSVIAQTESSGTIPAFRGMAYQVLDEWELSRFGNAVPLTEALIDPDPSMLWSGAIAAVLERSGITDYDVSGVSDRAFEGYLITGTTPGAQALQPMMMAGQIVAQERDGTLAFFDIENADVVQIENGAQFTDLGARAGGDTPNTADKILHGQVDQSDLPTSVVVTHQDPDNLYADGAQHFGLRQPSGVDHENRQEVNLSTLVLTRKEARNLAATIMRRTWVNSSTVEVSLPVAYLDLLENDIVTLTDDDGNVITARVIRREEGSNMLVNVVAVREHLQLEVSGSPVQGTNGTVPPVPPSATVLNVQALDIPNLENDFAHRPGLILTACAKQGGTWGGATIYESSDGGTNWTNVGILQFESLMGETVTSLDSSGTIGETTAGGPFWDAVNTVKVLLDSEGLFGLANVTESAVLQGVNWFMVGDEIIGARDATLNADGTYTLSYLLRGLRGTYDSAGNDKSAGQKVVGLYGIFASGLFRDVSASPTTSRAYKFVPAGLSIADVDEVPVTAQGWNARPFPVRDYSVSKNDARSRFTFAHWSRLRYPVGWTGPFQMDESFEEYVLRIYDPTNTDLKRVKTVTSRGTGAGKLRDRWIDYPAAEQTADGYTPGASETYWVEFAQVGEHGEGRTWRQEV